MKRFLTLALCTLLMACTGEENIYREYECYFVFDTFLHPLPCQLTATLGNLGQYVKIETRVLIGPVNPGYLEDEFVFATRIAIAWVGRTKAGSRGFEMVEDFGDFDLTHCTIVVGVVDVFEKRSHVSKPVGSHFFWIQCHILFLLFKTKVMIFPEIPVGLAQAGQPRLRQNKKARLTRSLLIVRSDVENGGAAYNSKVEYEVCSPFSDFFLIRLELRFCPTKNVVLEKLATLLFCLILIVG